ncbi:MAG: hypothetical protein Q8Q59_01005 [Luteolibacter sp.]|jgi:hypothetical protein|nr:hypothetical protein [Luteolibacter sp.]
MPRTNQYVPPGFIYYPASSQFANTPNLGTIRNNHDGWLGMKFTIGASPIVIHELARWVVAGNTQSHNVKLVDAATNLDLPGGTVSITTAGEPVGFKHVPLPTPITLAAGASYFLLSRETYLGDQWHDSTALVPIAGGIATVNNNANSNGPNPPYDNGGTSGSCHGPLNFKYTAIGQPLVTGHSMNTQSNDITGWLGMSLTTGSTGLTVSQLGRWVLPGNTGSHTVKLVDALTGTTLASANIATAGAPAEQFKYAPLSAPVALAANSTYYLLSQESAGGDQWYDFSQPAAGTATGYQQWLLTNGLPMDASGNGSAIATPNQDGVANLIKYALGLSPDTNGNGGHLGYGSVNEGGSDYLSFTYTRPEPPPTDITYSVQASSDLSTGSWSTSGLTESGSTVNAGLRTITIRDNVPMLAPNRRFMRLEVTQP